MEMQILLVGVGVFAAWLLLSHFMLKKKQEKGPSQNCYRLLDEDAEF